MMMNHVLFLLLLSLLSHVFVYTVYN